MSNHYGYYSHWTLAVVVGGKVSSYHFETYSELDKFFSALRGVKSYEIYEPGFEV